MFILYFLISMAVIYTFSTNGVITPFQSFIAVMAVITLTPIIYLIENYQTRHHKNGKYETRIEEDTQI